MNAISLRLDLVKPCEVLLVAQTKLTDAIAEHERLVRKKGDIKADESSILKAATLDDAATFRGDE